MEHERFDIEKVQVNFQSSLKDQTDIFMEFYLKGYRELYKYEVKRIYLI